MRKYSNGIKRLAAEKAAQRQGFEVHSATARGVPERARFELRRPNQKPSNAVVRTTEEGLFGFRRDDKGEWKPLKNADLVLTVMRSGDRRHSGLEVLAFSKEIIVATLDAALAQLIAADRRPPNEIPVFISVDAYNKTDLGHATPGIRAHARWSEVIHVEELEELINDGDNDYIEEARREFAKRNGVDVRKVTVTFGVGP
jgi:hypothetical protein